MNFTNGKGLEALVEICSKRNDFTFKVREIIHHKIKDQNTQIALSPLKKSNFFGSPIKRIEISTTKNIVIE